VANALSPTVIKSSFGRFVNVIVGWSSAQVGVDHKARSRPSTVLVLWTGFIMTVLVARSVFHVSAQRAISAGVGRIFARTVGLP
jgi:hypothetical protein